MHCAKAMNDDEGVSAAASCLLGDSVVDQLSLAACYCNNGNVAQAIEIYQRLLGRDQEAISYYLAVAYYLQDHYDVTLKYLHVYENARPPSPLTINLRACASFIIYNAKAAEQEIRTSITSMSRKGVWTSATLEAGILQAKTIRHNLMVFREGQEAKMVSISKSEMVAVVLG